MEYYKYNKRKETEISLVYSFFLERQKHWWYKICKVHWKKIEVTFVKD